MSGEETTAQLADELVHLKQVLQQDRTLAQGIMSRAGFSVSRMDGACDMVRHFVDRNRAQQKLEDGLRERLKAAEARADTMLSALALAAPELHCLRRQTQARIGGSVDRATEAVMNIIANEKGATRKIVEQRKKAEEDSGSSLVDAFCAADDAIGSALMSAVSKYRTGCSAADGTVRPSDQPIAGGDRSKDPGRPR